MFAEAAGFGIFRTASGKETTIPPACNLHPHRLHVQTIFVLAGLSPLMPIETMPLLTEGYK